ELLVDSYRLDGYERLELIGRGTVAGIRDFLRDDELPLVHPRVAAVVQVLALDHFGIRAVDVAHDVADERLARSLLRGPDNGCGMELRAGMLDRIGEPRPEPRLKRLVAEA